MTVCNGVLPWTSAFAPRCGRTLMRPSLFGLSFSLPYAGKVTSVQSNSTDSLRARRGFSLLLFFLQAFPP